MRHTALSLLIALSVLAAACNKHGNPSNDSLAGTWELRETSAAMMPGSTQHPAGNGNKLDFKDSEYRIYKAGQLVRSGQFSIVKDTTAQNNICLILPAGKFTSRLIYNDSTSGKIFYQIEGSKVRFYSGCYAVDAGHSEVYERISSGTGAH